MITTLVVAACSSQRFEFVWDERYVVAARAHDQSDWDAAQGHYAQLLKHAPDADSRRLILYRMALMAQERGRTDEALDAYAEVYEADVTDEWGARALRRAALLTAERGEQVAAADMMARLVQRYPDSVAAQHGIRHVRDYHLRRADGGPEAAATALKALQPAMEGHLQEDFLLFTRAQLADGPLARPEAALSLYDAIIGLDPGGAYADDAVWETAQIHIRAERWPEALGALKRLLREHTGTSWFVGTYNSEFADDARMERGRIYMEELDKPEQAIAEYRQFVREFPDSRLRDDAAWHMVRATQAMGGDVEGAMRAFVEEYPESRHARKARARLGLTPEDDDR